VVVVVVQAVAVVVTGCAVAAAQCDTECYNTSVCAIGDALCSVD
jgi:hypothetical protein